MTKSRLPRLSFCSPKILWQASKRQIQYKYERRIRDITNIPVGVSGHGDLGRL